jgi:hypothetical protein
VQTATTIPPRTNGLAGKELDHARELVAKYHATKKEIGKVIIGQDQIIDELLIALLGRGHTLLIGVPGNTLDLYTGKCARPEVQQDPVYARSHAV